MFMFDSFPPRGNSLVVRLLAAIVVLAVIFAQGAEIGIQINLGVFKWYEHFSFFTTWSSILSAGCSLWVLISPLRAQLAQQWALCNLSMSAIIVGLVYWLLVKTPGYWFVSSELLLHAVVPMATVLLFLAFSWQNSPRLATELALFTWIVLPLSYAIFVVIRGLTSGWYPYNFLDASKHGWLQVSLTMAGLLVGALTISLLLRLAVVTPYRLRRRN